MKNPPNFWITFFAVAAVAGFLARAELFSLITSADSAHPGSVPTWLSDANHKIHRKWNYITCLSIFGVYMFQAAFHTWRYEGRGPLRVARDCAKDRQVKDVVVHTLVPAAAILALIALFSFVCNTVYARKHPAAEQVSPSNSKAK